MTFLQLPFSESRKRPCFVNSRTFTATNNRKFRDFLGGLRWENVLKSNNIDDSYNLFWTEFKLLFDQNFPIKRVKFNKNFHKICNYMTQGLMVSRRTKIKLHKIAIHSPSHLNNSNYKKYRNLYNTIDQSQQKVLLFRKP